MTQKDLYRILGVSPNAKPDEIRSAYRRLLRRYHPDVYRGDPAVAAANCREVVDAYDVLIDPVARADYDSERFDHPPRALRTRSRSTTHAPRPPSDPPPPPPPPAPRVHRAPVQRVARRPSSGATTPPPPTPAGGLWSLHAEDREPEGSRVLPRSAGFWPHWRSRIVHFRSGFFISPTMVRAILVSVLLVAVAIGIAATVPYNHTFSLSVGPSTSPLAAGFCGQAVSIPTAAYVSFSWHADEGGSNSSSTPLIEVVGPAGSATDAVVAWVGSGGFVSQGGQYAFGIQGCYGEAEYSAQFSGEYSAPLL